MRAYRRERGSAAGPGAVNVAGQSDHDALITMRRRCGKPTCRCADGTVLHEAPALSVSVSGRSVTVTLRDAEVPAARGVGPLPGRPRRAGGAGPRRGGAAADLDGPLVAGWVVLLGLTVRCSLRRAGRRAVAVATPCHLVRVPEHPR